MVGLLQGGGGGAFGPARQSSAGDAVGLRRHVGLCFAAQQDSRALGGLPMALSTIHTIIQSRRSLCPGRMECVV